MKASKNYPAALEYLEKGFSVIPIKQKSKRPKFQWKKYQKEHPKKLDLREWFSKGDANIAIVTGKISNIVVVDIDTKEGMDFVKSLNISDTPMVKTGIGYHMYFAYEPGLKNFHTRPDFPGIDFRGEGGYVVAPPSVHENGGKYEWVEGKGFKDLEPQKLPDIFKPRPAGSDIKGSFDYDRALKGVPAGERNNTLARLTGRWINSRISKKEIYAKANDWNNSNHPPMSEEEVKRTVDSILRKAEREKGIVKTKNLKEVETIPKGTEKLFLFQNEKDATIFNNYFSRDFFSISYNDLKYYDLSKHNIKQLIIYEAINQPVTNLAKKLTNENPETDVKVFSSRSKYNFYNYTGGLEIDKEKLANFTLREKLNNDIKAIPIRYEIFNQKNWKNRILTNRSILSTKDFLSADFRTDNEIYLDPWIDSDTYVLLASRPGVGKTWFLMEIAGSVSCGRCSFGGLWKAPQPRKVLYIDGEMPAIALRNRLRFLPESDNIDFLSSTELEKEGVKPPINIDNIEFRKFVSQMVEEKDYDLVIFDNLISLFSDYGKLGDEGWSEVNRWLISLRSIGVASIVVHHTGKAIGADQLGTSTREANVNLSLLLKPIKVSEEYEKEAAFKIEIPKDRNGVMRNIDNLIFRLQDGVWNIEESKKRSKSSDIDKEKLAKAIRGLKNGRTQKDIAREIKVSESHFSRKIKAEIFGNNGEKAYLTKEEKEYKLTLDGKEFLNSFSF